MLNDAWELKKKLSPLVTDKYIDEIYKTGIDCGALGGKLLGAGGGGFILFFANKRTQQKIKNKLYKLQSTNIKFTEKGSEIIYNQ
jgi:D-glycero-alpha-D-manno-heptose-7-phosphate kinase